MAKLEVKVEPEPTHINLVVKEQNGATTHFKMKRDTPLKKVNANNNKQNDFNK